jgi:hypothetical protein
MAANGRCVVSLVVAPPTDSTPSFTPRIQPLAVFVTADHGACSGHCELSERTSVTNKNLHSTNSITRCFQQLIIMAPDVMLGVTAAHEVLRVPY